MTEETPRPAAGGSPLANLRQRREAKVAKLYMDLSVRGLEPLVVRYRPVTAAEITRTNKRFEKSKADDVDVLINAVILSQACLGIFDKPDATASVPTNEAWPRFDKDLAQSLGLNPEAVQGVDVVRALYLTDGDIISTGAELSQWSGFTLSDVDRDVAGN